MKKIAIYGAAFFDIIKLIDAINRNKLEWEIIGFIDDTPSLQGQTYNGYKILGNRTILPQLVDEGIYVINNVSKNCQNIKLVSDIIESYGCKVPNLIHPAIDLNYVTLGHGCILPEGCIVGGQSVLGNFVIARLGALISHNVTLGSCSFIAPGATIGGGCTIGEQVFIGTGSIVMNHREVGANCTVGAGSVVTKNIPADTTVIGVPAKPYIRSTTNA